MGAPAYGQYMTGKQQEANAKYNAEILANQALEEKAAASYEAERLAERGQRLKATQRSLYSKAGVTGAGSPLLVLDQTQQDFLRDQQMLLRTGRNRAGYLTSQSRLSRMSGKSARWAGIIGAGTSLLSGGTQAYGIYKGL